MKGLRWLLYLPLGKRSVLGPWRRVIGLLLRSLALLSLEQGDARTLEPMGL